MPTPPRSRDLLKYYKCVLVPALVIHLDTLTMETICFELFFAFLKYVQKPCRTAVTLCSAFVYKQGRIENLEPNHVYMVQVAGATKSVFRQNPQFIVGTFSVPRAITLKGIII